MQTILIFMFRPARRQGCIVCLRIQLFQQRLHNDANFCNVIIPRQSSLGSPPLLRSKPCRLPGCGQCPGCGPMNNSQRPATKRQTSEVNTGRHFLLSNPSHHTKPMHDSHIELTPGFEAVKDPFMLTWASA